MARLEAMNGSGASSELELALGDVGWVRALARGLVRDPHAAEDLAQETWLVALRAPGAARGGLRAWLGGVARNLAQRRFCRPGPRASGLMEEATEHGATPAELLAQADFQRRVLAAVTALDEPYRTTVLLRYFEGLSVEHLSRRMGVPGSTGRTRLQRAHAELRERLDREFGERRTWSALAASGAAGVLPGTLLEVGIMGTKALWIAGGVLVAGGALAWRVLDVERGDTEALASRADTIEPEHETDVRADPEPTSNRVELAVAERGSQGGESTRVEPVLQAADASPEGPLPEGTRVTQDLDLVAESFLTERPQVPELLEVVRDLAAQAVVLPESVLLTTDAAGRVLRVEGKFSIGDLSGSFEYDEHGYRVELPKGFPEDALMFQRDVQVRFLEQGSRAGDCSASVQFHPRTNEPVSRHLAPGEERFAGWSLGVNLENGTTARPITMSMSADGRGWMIGRFGQAQPQELPWLYDTSPFEAWLRVLRLHVKR